VPFAEKVKITRGFLAEFRRTRNFDAAHGEYARGKAQGLSGQAIQKAQTAAFSTLSDLNKQPELLPQVLGLLIDLFQAIDEGRTFERAWFAEHGYHWCVMGYGPFDDKDPKQLAEYKSFADRNDMYCSHSNDAAELKNRDREASLSFYYLLFGNSYITGEKRDVYTHLVNASALPKARKAMLLDCLAHPQAKFVRDGGWEPGELYPDVPPPPDLPLAKPRPAAPAPPAAIH
jgi:hypothetical protein